MPHPAVTSVVVRSQALDQFWKPDHLDIVSDPLIVGQVALDKADHLSELCLITQLHLGTHKLETLGSSTQREGFLISPLVITLAFSMV